MINVYLDDLRPCPPGFVLARNVDECLALLESGNVRYLSLDHDLGENEPTGYDLTKIMVERGLWPLRIYMHTANPVGRDNMYQLLTRYKPEGISVHYGPIPFEYSEGVSLE
jgi:hypothetical protein